MFAKSPPQKLKILMKLCQQFEFKLENMDNGMKDMLLDGGSNVNNFKEEIWVENTSTSSFCNNDG